MTDPLINEILTFGQSLGSHPARLMLPEEGAIAARVSENRVVVTRRAAWLAELQPADLVHLDFERMTVVTAQDPVLPEDLTGAQIYAAPGMLPHDDAALFVYLLGLDENIRVAAHIHPIIVDQITASPRARQFADRRTVHNEVLALGAASLLVNYAEPGMGLTREVQKKMVLWRDRNKSVPRVILVQNHGVIVLGEDPVHLRHTIDCVLKFAEIFVGASLLGGPVFLTPQAITQIEHNRGA